MNVKIHEKAAMELNEAIHWYDGQAAGLGGRFKQVVLSQVAKIVENPTWFLREDEDIFKAYVPKFPYKILYTVEKERVIIWAFAHLHRKPWYWQSRIN